MKAKTVNGIGALSAFPSCDLHSSRRAPIELAASRPAAARKEVQP